MFGFDVYDIILTMYDSFTETYKRYKVQNTFHYFKDEEKLIVMFLYEGDVFKSSFDYGIIDILQPKLFKLFIDKNNNITTEITRFSNTSNNRFSNGVKYNTINKEGDKWQLITVENYPRQIVKDILPSVKKCITVKKKSVLTSLKENMYHQILKIHNKFQY